MSKMFPAGVMALSLSLIIALPANAQKPPTAKEKGRMPVGDELNGPPPPMAPMPPSPPITPEKKALIKEFMRLLNASTNTEAIITQFMDQSLRHHGPLLSQELLREIPQENLSGVEQMRLKSEADQAARRILARVRNEFPRRIDFGELLEVTGMAMYGQHFSDEELKELIAFHKTPVAQKLLRLLPQVTGDALPRIQEWIMPKFIEFASEIIAEEKKKLQIR